MNSTIGTLTLEKNFYDWCITHMSDSSANRYISELKNVNFNLNIDDDISSNIFSCSSYDKLKDIIQFLESIPEYHNRNNRQNGWLRTSLNNYSKFLKKYNNILKNNASNISYWLGGAMYDIDVSQVFIEKGVFAINFGEEDITDIVTNPEALNDWINNIFDINAKKAFRLFSKMKSGDKIAIKSAYAKGKTSMLRIKAIGTIVGDLENDYVFDKDLWHTIPVEWEEVTPFKDYKIGGYLRTIHEVTKKEDIDIIFNGKNKYLKDDFEKWLKVPTRLNGNPYDYKTVRAYLGLAEKEAGKLSPPYEGRTDLFTYTSVSDFSIVHKVLNEMNSLYESRNVNGAFPKVLKLYARFLTERNSNVDERYNESEPLQENNTFFNYNVNISKEQWLEMIDNSIITQNDIMLLKKWLYFNGQATCTEVGKAFNAHPSSYIKPVVSMARRIQEYTDCETRINDDTGDVAWWNIPFIGKYLNNGEQFEWTIRPELYKALITKGITPFIPPALEKYGEAEFFAEVYCDEENYNDIIALLKRKKNIILQGAPGVGKSYMAKRLAYSMIGAKDVNKVEMIQFHQNYSYEDFIEGFRPSEGGNFKLVKGVFYKFYEKAKDDKSNDYFFIIDEINRGNLSKIMGELMLLLENDKRGEEFAMKLTYSCEPFYVPENIYLIGMMNTADRSLAMIDYALRRRFSFIPIGPVFDNPHFIDNFKNNYHDAETVIEKIKKLTIIFPKISIADIKSDIAIFALISRLMKRILKALLNTKLKNY